MYNHTLYSYPVLQKISFMVVLVHREKSGFKTVFETAGGMLQEGFIWAP